MRRRVQLIDAVVSNDGWHAADLDVPRRAAQARAFGCGAIRTATADAGRSHARGSGRYVASSHGGCSPSR
ncbi:hypothetical protein, partial [Xanthomonas citri]|uniref:hypothetical protein n=1 Tax=Xanthomonas citri TaxID=346 RepID=UPI001A9D04C1